MRAVCTACGASGVLRTGWLPLDEAQRVLAHAPAILADPARRRVRGGRSEVRVRVRQRVCPKCGERALRRAADPADVADVLNRVQRDIKHP